MGIFDYKNYGSAASKAMVIESMALVRYNFRDMFHQLLDLYKKNGLNITILKGLMMPTPTLDELKADVGQYGWKLLTPQQLGYKGAVSIAGTFMGKAPFNLGDELDVFAKYDEHGQVISLALAFTGTGALTPEYKVFNFINDVLNDMAIALLPDAYAENYTASAFSELLQKIADFAKQHGLSGEDVLVTGTSLGGQAVNSLATLSDSHWGGFYQNANYICYASPTQDYQSDRVLNIGFENDPVFRVLDNYAMRWSTFFEHDTAKVTTTDNIVCFNDLYLSPIVQLFPFGLFRLDEWLTHLPANYDMTFNKLLVSDFYDLMYRDSNVIISNLSQITQGKYWVQDFNHYAEKHTDTTFILGSDDNDLLQGGSGNDYLEGFAGDDRFRDAGGYNLIAGGEGKNTFELQTELETVQMVRDQSGTLYLTAQDGALSLLRDIEQITAPTADNQVSTYSVTEQGLLSEVGQLLQYASSLQQPSLGSYVSQTANEWIISSENNDLIITAKVGGNHIAAGDGDDRIYLLGGDNQLLFDGEFGQDTVYGLHASDKLIFMATGDSTYNHDPVSHLKAVDNGVQVSFGENSVTLVGATLEQLHNEQFVIV